MQQNLQDKLTEKEEALIKLKEQAKSALQKLKDEKQRRWHN